MTDRVAVYPSEIIYSSDMLQTNRYPYIGVGCLTDAILGSTTQINGFPCTAQTPTPNLSVNVGAGEIYIQQAVDTTAYPTSDGGLPADPKLIMKQGIYPTLTNFPLAAPGTVGYSINYLIEVEFDELDTNIVSRPYYNSSNPSSPVFNNVATVRKDTAVVTAKAGVAAITGTQVTPAPDAGNIGMWVVTVANGQTQITSGDINRYTNAPFIIDKLKDKISQEVADRLYEKRNFYVDSGTANTYVLTLSSLYGTAPAYYNGMKGNFFALVGNSGGASTVNFDGVGAVALVTPQNTALPANVIDSGDYIESVYKASISKFVMTNIKPNVDSGVSLIGFSANEVFSLTGGVGEKILSFTLVSQTFDIWNSVDTRIQPTLAGWYRVTVSINALTDTEAVFYPVKNGSTSDFTICQTTAAATTVESLVTGSNLIYFDGTDYVEIYVISDLSAGVTVLKQPTGIAIDSTFIQVEYLGS